VVNDSIVQYETKEINLERKMHVSLFFWEQKRN